MTRSGGTVTKQRCTLIPEVKCRQIPYTTCHMVRKDHCRYETRYHCYTVPECRTVCVPYTTCRMVKQEHGREVTKRQCYWVAEQEGKIFCLVDAPHADAANTVHREAHGLVADEIFAVTEGG